MLILGIETSCDETAAALVQVDKNNLKVLSNVVSSQIPIHRKYKGIVPEVAARAHFEKILPVILASLRKSLEQISAIAVTYGPGLITSLLVGLEAAKTLSYLFKKPLIPINHLEGHIYANWLSDFKVLQSAKVFPAVCLVVSGGHTELLLMEDYGQFKRLGATRDDAAGECFDKVARLLNLGYPGGPAIEAAARLAEAGTQNYYRGRTSIASLPRPMIHSHNFDFSFSGLKTAVLYKTKKTKINQEFVRAMAQEVQESVVDVLVSKTIKAAKRFEARSIILSGGVAANSRLREEMKKQATKIKKIFLVPPKKFCTDNAVMIAMAGYFRYNLLNKKQRLGLLNNWQKIKVDPNAVL